MSRPLPNSAFLANLAREIQPREDLGIDLPALLGVDSMRRLAVLAGHEERKLALYDLEKKRITRTLDVNTKARYGTDFRNVTFDLSSTLLGGYSKFDKSFNAWSLETGESLGHFKGEGLIPPEIMFLTKSQLAVADGPHITIYDLKNDTSGYIALSGDLASIVFYPSPATPGLLIAVAAFARGEGHALACFHMRSGKVVASGEGPFRKKPEGAAYDHTITLHELHHIPGATNSSLIMLEEERIRFEGLEDDPPEADRFVSRLLAIDPPRCNFHEDQMDMEGRFCLETDGTQLSLVDELGRVRSVLGFPLRVQNADWRLQT